MTMDRAHSNGAISKTNPSSSLPELLSIIGAESQSSKNDTSSLDILVAFRKKAHPPLSVKDLTIAFQDCFLNFHPSTLLLKVFIIDWLTDLVKSSNDFTAPSPIILDIYKVLVRLNLTRQETEEWMPLFISLCSLTDACLVAVRSLKQPAMISFLKDGTCMTLASVVLETGKRVFRHPDRSQIKRERSEGYIEWSQKTLNLTKNFQVFMGDQIQQDSELREHAIDVTIGVSNMLLDYANEARSEYAYLNLAFKCLVILVPNCKQERPIRFEVQSAIRTICDGILGSFHEIFNLCSQNQQVSDNLISRRWTLAKFYIAQLRSLATTLFKDICGSGSDAAACRGMIRYVLFFTRSRFISNEMIKKSYPNIQSEIAKFVNAVEEIVVSALFGSEKASDDEKRSLIHEFALASGPRSAFDLGEPLSNYEWDVGRLKFLLKTISIFDEFSPALQLQLYPIHGVLAQESILSKIVDSVDVIGLREFGSVTIDGVGQENGDLYFRILSDLCTFSFLLQPKQFAKLQIDMVGLVLAQSELWSMIAEGWWSCVSERLGQEFTMIQVQVLVELLLSLPTGKASQKVGNLIACLAPLLNEEAQSILTTSLISIFDSKLHQNVQTLLTNFPYECLSSSNLDLLVNRCTDGWRESCEFLSDERLVLEAFYTMHQYVACLASIFSKSEHRHTISDDARVTLIGWSVEIIGGAHELLMLIKDDQKALDKISRTIEDLFAFLQSMQPLPCSQLINVLDTVVSWESLPREQQPLSRLSIAKFLSSCSSVEIPEDSYMIKMKTLFRSLFDNLLRDKEWVVIHGSLMSLAEFCKNTPHLGIAEACISSSFRDTIRKMIEQGKEGLGLTLEDTPSFWATIGAKMINSQTRRFNGGTILDLQETSRMRPSSQACVSALSTLARYLETLDDDRQDEGILRHVLNGELSKIQKLSLSQK